VGSHYRAIVELLPIQNDPILDFYPNRYPARVYIRSGLKALNNPRSSSYISILRAWMLARLDKHAGEAAPVAKALLLSDQGAKKLYRDPLRDGGMIHLIVVSGLHVWFIYGMLILLLKFLLPPRMAELIFMVLILCFAALNYWAAPITRAMIMILTGITARWMGRRVSSLQMLALSLLIITLAAPRQLFDLGLQLSFLSVGVITLALPSFSLWSQKWHPLSLWRIALDRLLNYLLLSFMVSVAILPLTLHGFGSGSLNRVIGNLLGVPLIGLLLPLSVLMLIFSPSGLIGAGFNAAYRFTVWLFERWMLICASLPFSLASAWIDLGQALGMALLVLPFYMWARRVRRPLWALYIPLWSIGLLLVGLLPLVKPTRGGIWQFNCGTADCALIVTPGGHSILVDSGPSNASWEAERDPSKALDTNSWASRKLLPWLKRRGIKDLDELIITHTHADHSGGVPALASSLPVRRVIITDETRASELWRLWKAQGWFDQSKVLTVTDTLSLVLDKTRLTFLHPDRDWNTDSENDRSIVFRLDHKGKSWLFTGDIEASSEAWLLSRYPDQIDVDYLKVPHHGSRTSNTEPFLQQVSARDAWISTAKRNRFDFPHTETLINLRRHSERIRQTSDGTIHMPL
jgi:competence protein ComEC